MIIFDIDLQEPQLGNQDTFDLRIITNKSLTNTVHQARLGAQNGHVVNWSLRFKDCNRLDDLRTALIANTGLPISMITFGKSYYGLVINQDIIFDEDSKDVYTLNMQLYIISIGEFSTLLDPNGDYILDPSGMPLEGP